MLNYIKAELYRNFHRAYFWIYTGILTILPLIINIICKFQNSNVSTTGLKELFGIGIYMIAFPIFVVLAFVDMTTAEEQKNQTMRNIVSFGMERNKIVLSKLMTSVILAFLSAIIILVVFYGSGAILFGLGNNFSAIASEFLVRILAAIPLWIGSIAIAIFLALLINNNTIFTLIYIGLFLITPSIIGLLTYFVSKNFKYLGNILITTQLGKLKATTPNIACQDLISAVAIGIMYVIVFTILSMIYFKRKEVK